MTIQDAIEWVDRKKYNVYTREDKLRWLSEQDGEVWEFLSNFEEFDGTFSGYDDTTELSRELLVPAPYDRLYLRWLEAQIDYANQEYTKFNNAMALHLAAWREFAARCIRKYHYKGEKIRYF